MRSSGPAKIKDGLRSSDISNFFLKISNCQSLRSGFKDEAQEANHLAKEANEKPGLRGVICDFRQDVADAA